MTPSLLVLLAAVAAADQPPSAEPKPVAATRDEIKALLEAHKRARPRLPMPPADFDPAGQNRVNNGRFRAYYIPAELSGSTGGGGGGMGREPDTAMTLDNTFKVKLFWVTSRTNNCYYCLGHQEHKLAGAGVSDDDIAALDGDWAGFPANEKAALAFTRKLTFRPDTVGPADIAELTKHYTPTQVLEILVTVAGYNATNRWTDGLNIPAEDNAEFFRKSTAPAKADFSTFKTPTSPKFAELVSAVAPLPAACKTASAPFVPTRAELEPREKVEAAWAAAKTRTATLPVATAAAAKDLWKGDNPPNWVKLLATFPKTARGRVAGLVAANEKGALSPKVKGEIAWVTARHDRAWYALAAAREQLLAAGLTDDQIFALDTPAADRPAAETAAMNVARKLSVAPSTVTDADIEGLRKLYKDAEVAEIVHRVCNAAFFNRVTEAANLPLDGK